MPGSSQPRSGEVRAEWSPTLGSQLSHPVVGARELSTLIPLQGCYVTIGEQFRTSEEAAYATNDYCETRKVNHGSEPVLKSFPTVGWDLLEYTLRVMKLADLTMKLAKINGSHYKPC